MTRAATEVMHDVMVAAVIDAVMALRATSGGLPNTLLRELNAIHANTTFADLPKELQAAINASVRSAFTRLLKEGYNVASGTAPPPRPPASRQVPSGRPPRSPQRPPGPDRKGGPARPGPRGKPRGPGGPKPR